MTNKYDGSYYAEGRAVFRHPLQSATGISMGFRVCELSEGVNDEGAQEIADALNAADRLTPIEASAAADALRSIPRKPGKAYPNMDRLIAKLDKET
jgi:hypothetical protein